MTPEYMQKYSRKIKSLFGWQKTKFFSYDQHERNKETDHRGVAAAVYASSESTLAF
jgi:hypothetical protein